MKIIILLVMAWATNSNPTEIKKQPVEPYDLQEEILKQLEELLFLVDRYIFEALDDLTEMVHQINIAADHALTSAEVDMGSQHDIFISQINSVKQLAQSAGADIEICLVDSLPALEKLLPDSLENLTECLEFANKQATTIQTDSKYRLDILINEVHMLEFQVEVCAGDLLCLQPLMVQIELAMVNIPQQVGVQLQAASDLHEQLKLDIKQCSDDKLAHYNTEGGIIVANVIDCANKIIS